MDYSGSNTEYASKGVAGAGLGLGIAGTTLGLLGSNLGLFGNNNNAAQYTQELAAKDAEIAMLKASSATDAKLVEVYSELRSQDKTQDATISNLNSRIAALEVAAPLKEQLMLSQVQNVANSVTSLGNYTQLQINDINSTLNNLTKTVIPNTSVCPGWGNITITTTSATSST